METGDVATSKNNIGILQLWSRDTFAVGWWNNNILKQNVKEKDGEPQSADLNFMQMVEDCDWAKIIAKHEVKWVRESLHVLSILFCFGYVVIMIERIGSG